LVILKGTNQQVPELLMMTDSVLEPCFCQHKEFLGEHSCTSSRATVEVSSPFVSARKIKRPVPFNPKQGITKRLAWLAHLACAGPASVSSWARGYSWREPYPGEEAEGKGVKDGRFGDEFHASWCSPFAASVMMGMGCACALWLCGAITLSHPPYCSRALMNHDGARRSSFRMDGVALQLCLTVAPPKWKECN